jgi:hypothetical protein
VPDVGAPRRFDRRCGSTVAELADEYGVELVDPAEVAQRGGNVVGFLNLLCIYDLPPERNQ